ncbi:unnamed protein product [Rotaria socialis]|uniref:Transporter n=4 Tax=Rotaria socialis TaxID=392032 RepID=A0A820VX04_9BILA|nr:unnamed protein product [Rotaria socialis]CAF4506071.1 unnamed protein product [Rotaria socialis]
MLNRVRALIRSRSVLEQPFEEGRPTNSKEEVREEWDRPIEFILSLVGCSVGLGNVWRYPYIAFKNGGGAFLIPYFCVYFLIGTPLYFLELSLGQFGSRGTTVAFKMTRMFKGIGWAMAINSFLVTIYYNVIIAWCLFYFFASFRRTLPWSGCDNWWNTPSCSNPDGLKNSTANFLCLSGNRLNNCSIPTSPPEEYFDHFVLRRSDSMEAMGSPHWSLALCLLLAWILVAICIIQGIKSSGKVVYFTSLFPYVVIFALVIRGVTLPGAANGISFYLKPNWSKVREFEVWIAAASQVTFSLSVGFGSILGYASFNKFKSNYLRDCLLVTACDCFTSVFAGFAVFPILGFMSYKTGLPVDQVVKAGPGLAFIAYPQALSIMPGGPFWAVTFFFMLLTLGLDSQFALSDVTISGLLDNFSGLRRYKPFVIIGYCVACYLLALPMCAPGGIYLFTLMNEYSANLSVIVCGFFEFIIIAYIYGFNKFMEDIRMMLDKRPFEPYWFFTWCISGPIITLIVFFSSIIQFRAPTEGNYTYLPYANALGWLMVGSSLIFIPGVMIYEFFKAWKVTNRSQNQITDTMPRYLRMLTYVSQPDDDWGPTRKEYQCGRYEKLTNTTSKNDRKPPDNEPVIFYNENINDAFDPAADLASRF